MLTADSDEKVFEVSFLKEFLLCDLSVLLDGLLDLLEFQSFFIVFLLSTKLFSGVLSAQSINTLRI